MPSSAAARGAAKVGPGESAVSIYAHALLRVAAIRVPAVRRPSAEVVEHPTGEDLALGRAAHWSMRVPVLQHRAACTQRRDCTWQRLRRRPRGVQSNAPPMPNPPRTTSSSSVRNSTILGCCFLSPRLAPALVLREQPRWRRASLFLFLLLTPGLAQTLPQNPKIISNFGCKDPINHDDLSGTQTRLGTISTKLVIT